MTVIETTELSNHELAGPARIAAVSPAVLASAGQASARRSAGIQIVRGTAAESAIASPFASVEDLADPVTDEEYEARLTQEDLDYRHERAEAGYQEGMAAGYRDGYEAGRAEALHELAAHAASSMSALQQAAAGLQACDAVTLAELDQQVAAFAFDLVAELLGRELALSTNPGRDAIVRALRFAPDRGDLVARLHPEDLALLGAVTDLMPGREIELVADGAVDRGGCILDVGACRIDAQLSTAMTRVADVLMGEAR